MAGRPLQDGDFVAILNDFDASRLDYLVKFGEKWKFFKKLLISRSFVLCLLAVPMSTFSPNNMKKTARKTRRSKGKQQPKSAIDLWVFLELEAR